MECIIGIPTRKAIKPGLYIKVISFDTTTFCLVCNQVDCCVCIHKLCFTSEGGENITLFTMGLIVKSFHQTF